MSGFTIPHIAMQPDDAAVIERLSSVIEQWCQTTRDFSAFYDTEDQDRLWAVQAEVVQLLGRAQRLMIEEATRLSDRITAHYTK